MRRRSKDVISYHPKSRVLLHILQGPLARMSSCGLFWGGYMGRGAGLPFVVLAYVYMQDT